MFTLAPSLVTHRDPKGRKFISIAEAAYDKADLSEKEAQRVNDTPGLAEAIADFIAKNRLTDQFKNEEVASEYAYPPEYKGPKPIKEQIAAIATIFGLNPAETLAFAKNLPELPKGADGWFTIPRWDKVASTYGEALEKVLASVKKSRTDGFYNYRDGALGPKHLQQSTRSLQFWEEVTAIQKGDILIVAAQFGFRHRGRSVRRAREVIIDNPGEFALGAFAVGCMTLTHPERFVRWEQLHTDCAGDEYAPDAAGGFSLAPRFDWYGGRLKFCACYLSDAHKQFGTVSAFLPQ